MSLVDRPSNLTRDRLINTLCGALSVGFNTATSHYLRRDSYEPFGPAEAGIAPLPLSGVAEALRYAHSREIIRVAAVAVRPLLS
jgi:hypothetical protein